MTRRPLFLVLLLLFGVALLAAWNKMAQRQGGMAAPVGLTLTTSGLLQRPLRATGDWFSDLGKTMFGRGGAVNENQTLRAEIADLRGQTQRLMRYRRENEQLRALLKMPKPAGGKILVADIIAPVSNDYRQRIGINVGARHGVKPKDIVFCAQGVVGQIVEVTPFTSRVLLLSDREAGIAAMVERTAARGIAKGTGGDTMEMNYLDFKADVREGDAVTTSANSEIFPQGLAIGRVLSTRRDKHYSRLSATIGLAAPIETLSAVAVRVAN